MTDKTGKRFGRLKVLGDSGLKSNGSIVWGCLCDCGKIALVLTGFLISGNTKSCGCLKREKSLDSMSRVGKLNRKYSKIEAKRQYLIHARQSDAKARRNMSDAYIKKKLTNYSILSSADIPPELIKLKRAEITARRLLREEIYNGYKA